MARKKNRGTALHRALLLSITRRIGTRPRVDGNILEIGYLFVDSFPLYCFCYTIELSLVPVQRKVSVSLYFPSEMHFFDTTKVFSAFDGKFHRNVSIGSNGWYTARIIFTQRQPETDVVKCHEHVSLGRVFKRCNRPHAMEKSCFLFLSDHEFYRKYNTSSLQKRTRAKHTGIARRSRDKCNDEAGNMQNGTSSCLPGEQARSADERRMLDETNHRERADRTRFFFFACLTSSLSASRLFAQRNRI